MDRPSLADLRLHAARAERVPDAEEPELLVEFRLARRDHAGDHDRHGRVPRHALHAACRLRLRQRRAHHARRQLRLADALRAHERRVVLLHRHLHPHLPRPLLRLLQEPRELLWMLGVVILLLMMATAFMGYVLPWGQMSYWGATVITNLFSAIPVVGD